LSDGLIQIGWIKKLMTNMEEVDYSIESDEEFYEDFSGRGLSDKELDEVLIEARKNSDAELRIIVKELQYARFLLKNIIEFVEADKSPFLNVRKLVENYVEATTRANRKSL